MSEKGLHAEISIKNESSVLSWIILDAKGNVSVDIKFALPGKERQDSVYSGLEVNALSNFWFLTLGELEIKPVVFLFEWIGSW